MSSTKQRDDLPKQSLHLDAECLKRIDQSRIRKSIVPLILMMRKANARRLSILSWDLEDESRYFGQVLALALSQQLEQKCALLISEGLKHKIDVFPSFALVTLPEVENHMMDADALEEFETGLRSFPVQIFSGPALSKSGVEHSHAFQIARQSDAQILLLRSSGASRDAIDRISSLTKNHGINWLCVMPAEIETRSTIALGGTNA